MASLSSIPPELGHQICTSLDLSDLPSLRYTSRYFSKLTVTKLAQRLEKENCLLPEIEVLATEEGLKTFKGLCDIDEMRKRIRYIDFVVPATWADARRDKKEAGFRA